MNRMLNRWTNTGRAVSALFAAAVAVLWGCLPARCGEGEGLQNSPPASKGSLYGALPSAQKVCFDPESVAQDIARYIDAAKAQNGLIPSFIGSAPFFFGSQSNSFHDCYYGKMGYLEDQGFTYDLAIAAIGLLLLDKKDHAEHILSVLEKDFYLKKNGRQGLFNSYFVTSNIPVEELTLGSDGDRVHAGPVLWVAIAALNHAKIMRNTRFLEFVLDVIEWCRSELTYYRFEDGEEGGISMGFGWGPDWSKIFSTEHNIDYYAVLRMLRDIYEESSEDVRDIFRKKNIEVAWIKKEMEREGRFIREVAFDKDEYCFIAGSNENGRDRLKILDGISWGLAGVGPENYAAWGIDVEKLALSAEKYFTASFPLSESRTVRGFDFTDYEGTDYSRSALVWFEGTGQMVSAYGELSCYFRKKGDKEKALFYRSKAVGYLNEMYKFSYENGLCGTLPYMAIQLSEKEIVKTLKYEWEIPRGKEGQWVRSLSSTMWFLYGVKGFYNCMKWSNEGVSL